MSVASLPGGEKLVELINKVTADPGAIQGIAQRWRHAATTCADADQRLTTATSVVDGSWQGPAADSFVGYMSGFTSLCDATREQLDSAASVLDQAGQLLENTKRTIVNRCDALVAEANTVRATLPNDTPPEEVNALLAQLVDQVYGELTPIVEQADGQLSGLAEQLTGPTGGGFGQYPEPSTAGFVPQPGQPIQWTPQPPEVAVTTPQGTGPNATGNAAEASGRTSSNSGAGHSGGGGGSSGGGGGHSNGGGTGSGGYGASGPPPPGGGPAPQGQVAEWIRQAIEILKAHGYAVEKMNPNDIWLIIRHESGGDPTAVNNWDSNAAKGTPSKGLMQTIDPTFNAYSLPGHKNIYDPVDNIIAGVRYAIERYGSVSNVPGVVGMKTGSGYRGY